MGPTLRPPLAEWPGVLDAWLARRDRSEFAPRAAEFRRELGLPADRPLILSGHQPVLWHPGILAKYVAASAAAKAWSTAHARACAAAWLVVDHDHADPGELRYPAVDESGRVFAAVAHPGGALPDMPERVAFAVPPLPRAALPSRPWPGIAQHLERLLDTVANLAPGSGNAAEQVARSYGPLVEGLCPALPLVFASRLAGTRFFSALVDRVARDPARCISTHNAAARAAPGAGVRPLDAARLELPLWQIMGEGTEMRREPVYAAGLASVPRGRLLPKALFLTAALRLAGCDLFIHGTGGEVYDRATDRWIADWLGESAMLAPTVAAAATLYLPLPSHGVVSERELNRLRQRVRAPRYSPAFVGDAAAESARRELVRAIASLPPHAPERRERFDTLHALLETYRRDRAGAIAAQESRARNAYTAAGADLSRDREWPFPLYPREALNALARL